MSHTFLEGEDRRPQDYVELAEKLTPADKKDCEHRSIGE